MYATRHHFDATHHPLRNSKVHFSFNFSLFIAIFELTYSLQCLPSSIVNIFFRFYIFPCWISFIYLSTRGMVRDLFIPTEAWICSPLFHFYTDIDIGVFFLLSLLMFIWKTSTLPRFFSNTRYTVKSSRCSIYALLYKFLQQSLSLLLSMFPEPFDCWPLFHFYTVIDNSLPEQFLQSSPLFSFYTVIDNGLPELLIT